MGLGAGILPALQLLAGELTNAGVPTSEDPTKVQVPGAWVTARAARVDTLEGDGTVDAYVYLIAGQGSGATDALAALGKLLDRLLTVLAPDGDISTAESISLPNTPPLPAFQVPVQLQIDV
jgi:hypothetical protein